MVKQFFSCRFRWDLGRGWTGVLVLVVKELGFLHVRSVVALPMAETVPWDEDQHPLPKSNPDLHPHPQPTIHGIPRRFHYTPL
jgi:hypothetical protein